jgi:hypothetical protein
MNLRLLLVLHVPEMYISDPLNPIKSIFIKIYLKYTLYLEY